VSGQSNKCLSLFADIHANRSVYDRIMKNANGVGFSIGLQINTLKRIKPLFEVNADFFMNSAVLVFENGNELVKKGSVPSILCGTKYQLLDRLFFSGEIGPGIIKSKAFIVIKPSLGYYIDKNQRLSVKMSLTHIFENDNAGDKPFGYINLGLVFRIL